MTSSVFIAIFVAAAPTAAAESPQDRARREPLRAHHGPKHFSTDSPDDRLRDREVLPSTSVCGAALTPAVRMKRWPAKPGLSGADDAADQSTAVTDTTEVCQV